MAAAALTLIKTLTLPYESVKTLYEGDCEVRVYRNEITGALQVGKRLSTLGLEQTVAVREATLLKQINHPYVCKVEDVARVDGFDPLLDVIELIMPFHERGSLFDCFERGERFSVGEAVRLTSEALLGLSELHEVRRIIHRDLKSPNILLSDQGHALIGDLGVALPMEDDGHVDALDSPRLWAPPETYTRRRISVRADIYQMGLVLHELTSGPLPYGAEPKYLLDRIAERLSRGSRGVVGGDMEFAPWVPPGIRRVVRKATALRPEDRYASARAMNDQLRRAEYIDWSGTVDEEGLKRWEGASARRPDRVYGLEAVRGRRDGAWKVRGLQHLNSWRRVHGPVICPDVHGRQVQEVFDELVKVASR
jgi:serine/threonine protein kinase